MPFGDYCLIFLGFFKQILGIVPVFISSFLIYDTLPARFRFFECSLVVLSRLLVILLVYMISYIFYYILIICYTLFPESIAKGSSAKSFVHVQLQTYTCRFALVKVPKIKS